MGEALDSELKLGPDLGPHGNISPLTQKMDDSWTILVRKGGPQSSVGWPTRKAPPQHSPFLSQTDSRKKHVSGKAGLLETGKPGLGKHLAFSKR